MLIQVFLSRSTNTANYLLVICWHMLTIVFCRELFPHHSAFLQRKVGKSETGWKESRFITVLFEAMISGYLVSVCNFLHFIFRESLGWQLNLQCIAKHLAYFISLSQISVSFSKLAYDSEWSLVISAVTRNMSLQVNQFISRVLCCIAISHPESRELSCTQTVAVSVLCIWSNTQ